MCVEMLLINLQAAKMLTKSILVKKKNQHKNILHWFFNLKEFLLLEPALERSEVRAERRVRHDLHFGGQTFHPIFVFTKT